MQRVHCITLPLENVLHSSCGVPGANKIYRVTVEKMLDLLFVQITPFRTISQHFLKPLTTQIKVRSFRVSWEYTITAHRLGFE